MIKLKLTSSQRWQIAGLILLTVITTVVGFFAYQKNLRDTRSETQESESGFFLSGTNEGEF